MNGSALKVESKETYILNFFFGEERTKPIKFKYQFEGLTNIASSNSTIEFPLNL